ncbi:MAG TPA: hypothetical protein H9827_02095 [Candidatus Luteimonas excrementigallinarum]|nr:hypothetical protein [Candidatus Luteimonas excrementigallinarum]
MMGLNRRLLCPRSRPPRDRPPGSPHCPSGRDYTQLSALVDAANLEPGDLVLVDGGTTYSGNIIVRSNDSGAPGNPVTFRWKGVGQSNWLDMGTIPGRWPGRVDRC